jgi:hypothetical protein
VAKVAELNFYFHEILIQKNIILAYLNFAINVNEKGNDLKVDIRTEDGKREELSPGVL